MSVREIVLDTETTGLFAKNGDKIIEIACIELDNKVPTGSKFQAYINPQRPISLESYNIHGISEEFLKDKPTFDVIARDFLKYIGNSTLIIHNAGFDVSFLNYELTLLGYPEISFGRVIDTLMLARKRYPRHPASLDALCKRFNISLHARTKHGALVDAELLAMVYIALTGGTQSSFELMNCDSEQLQSIEAMFRKQRPMRSFPVSDEEEQKHALMIEGISNSLWKAE